MNNMDRQVMVALLTAFLKYLENQGFYRTSPEDRGIIGEFLKEWKA